MTESCKIIQKIKIRQADHQSVTELSVQVIREVSLTIWVNNNIYANIACAGICLEELTVGFLVSEKIISSRNELGKITVDAEKYCVRVLLKKNKNIHPSKIKSIASSGSRGKNLYEAVQPLPPNDDGKKVKTSVILKLMDKLLNNSRLHRQTGGTHCSALVLGNSIKVLREDIGRHNTIDMLGGYILLNNIDPSDALLFTTGRISSEIVYKAWNLAIPVIVSHSAPTANAVHLARKANITLVGYVRGGKMNIYSQERRITT